MNAGDYDPPLAPGLVVAQSWQATVILGTVTLFLGIIVSFHPTGSLNVVAILLGMWFIVIGVLEIIGGLMLRRAASHVEARLTGSDGSAMSRS